MVPSGSSTGVASGRSSANASRAASSHLRDTGTSASRPAKRATSRCASAEAAAGDAPRESAQRRRLSRVWLPRCDRPLDMGANLAADEGERDPPAHLLLHEDDLGGADQAEDAGLPFGVDARGDPL